MGPAGVPRGLTVASCLYSCVVLVVLLAAAAPVHGQNLPKACTAPPQMMPEENATITFGCLEADCNYESGLACHWLIPSAADEVIDLAFNWIDLMESLDCVFDSLKLIQVTNSSSDTVLNVCGSDTPHSVTLPPGASVFVSFTSTTTLGKGFSVSYARHATSPPDSGHEDGPNEDSQGACSANRGGPLVVSNSSGVFGVGGDGGEVPTGAADCAWSVTPFSEEDVIWLWFDWIDLPVGPGEGSSNGAQCTDSFVTISTPTTVSHVCGSDINDTPTVKVNGDAVNVTFTSGATLPDDSGFQIHYRIAHQETDGPQFAPGFPMMTDVTETSATLKMAVVWPARVSLLLMEEAAPAPTVAEVLATAELPGVLLGTNVSLMDATATYTPSLEHLDGDTEYAMYLALRSFTTPPFVSSSVSELHFKTLGTVTDSVPAFADGFPVVTNVTGNSAVAHFELQAFGRLFYVVLPATSDAPSPNDVSQGHGSDGEQPLARGYEMDAMAGTEYTSEFNGLEPSTDYTLYAVQQQPADDGALAPAVTSVDFTTTNGECEVADWGPWGPCSADCGGGTRTRSRSVSIPGDNCPKLQDSESCGTEPCAAAAPACDGMVIANLTESPEGGLVATFGVGEEGTPLPTAFHNCSWLVPCASGERLRMWYSWLVMGDDPQTGDCADTGSYVAVTDGSDGSALDTLCGNHADATDNAWELSTDGTSVVVHMVVDVDHDDYSQGFAMNVEISEPDNKVDCEVGPWSDWSACSVECGSGLKSRTRPVRVPSENGGQDCPPLRDETTCNEQACLDPACVADSRPVTVTDESGKIEAGGLHAFTEATTCAWVIKGGADKTIHAWFTEVSVPSCHPDGVFLYDGSSVDDDLLASVCGPDLPSPVAVSGGDLRVEFVSNEFATSPSFSLTYMTETTATPHDCVVSAWGEWSACNATCNGYRSRTRTVEAEATDGGTCTDALVDEELCAGPCDDVACGDDKPQVLTATSGSIGIGSPDGGQYERNQDCQWRIDADASHTVSVWFTWLDLEEETMNACADFVSVTDSDGKTLEKVCGHQESTNETAFLEVHANGAVTVEFKSDYGIQRRGFALSYEITKSEPTSQDCTLSDWGEWSTCSAYCGGGTHTRSREVVVPAVGTGTCDSTTETKACNELACENDACGNGAQAPKLLTDASGSLTFEPEAGREPINVNCKWTIAHATVDSVTLSVQGLTTAPPVNGECSDTRLSVFGNAESATADVVQCGLGCDPCVMEVTEEDGGNHVLVTFETSEHPASDTTFSMNYNVASTGDVDCVSGDWGYWGVCSATCNGGSQARSRAVVVPQQGNGAACTDMTNSQMCNQEDCDKQAHLSATLTAEFTQVAWANGVPEFVAMFQEQLADALNIAIERVYVVAVGGLPVRLLGSGESATGADKTVQFQVLPPQQGTEVSTVGAVVNAYQAQLVDDTSSLRTTGVTRFLDPAATPSVDYGSEASVSLSTNMVKSDGGGSVTVTVTNSGSSKLVVSSISQDAPAVSWLSISPSFMTVAGGSSGDIHVSLSTANLAQGAYFQVVSLQHNDPSGPHAFGVQLRTGDGGNSNNGDEGGVFDSKGFLPGVLLGVGALVGVSLLVWGIVVLVQRKVMPGIRRALGLPPPRSERFKRLDSRPGPRSKSHDDDDDASASGLELKSVAVDGASGRGSENDSLVRSNTSSASPLTVPMSSSSLGRRGSGGAGAGASSSSSSGAGAGAGAGASAPSSTIRPPSALRGAPGITLSASPTLLAPDVFERKWEELSTIEIWGATLVRQLSENELEGLLSDVNITCMASGIINGMQKYYFYAEQASTSALFMAEVSFASSSRRLSAVIKGPVGASAGTSFVAVFKRALASLILE